MEVLQKASNRSSNRSKQTEDVETGSPFLSGRHGVYAVLSTILLTIQGSAMSLVLRYSRIQEGSKYLPSVAGASIVLTFFNYYLVSIYNCN